MNLDQLKTKLRESEEYKLAIEEKRAQFDLANCIVHARLQKGLSQAKLAEAVGTKQANISRIESGLANPTLLVIDKIMRVLDICMEFIPAGSIYNEWMERELPQQTTAYQYGTFFEGPAENKLRWQSSITQIKESEESCSCSN